ncbi:interferon gamma isoform X2 [Phascolarctos cinereus]|uniref:Interferon gamma n=1 Tax=Phascolarctos cinereus TaxID=38626 RepID=A0A6P5KMR2_PHACI|nr:interferon gamma isoform X2 [Phascolarctos cinereus]
MNYSSYLLASWLCVMLGYSQATIAEDLGTLMEYFNGSTSSDISDNGTLFLNMMDRWKEDGDKKILMSQIVTVYFKIFEIFKNNTVIKKSVENIKEDMIMKFFTNNTASKVNDFESVINTQVNDLRVQKKAIFELALIMNDLSNKPHLRKRKRRQNRKQGEIKQ